MQINYYPWDTEALSLWVKTEQLEYRNLELFAEELGLSLKEVQSWKDDPVPNITLEHIRAITKYRHWSFDQTIEWLRIRSMHLELLTQIG